MSRVMKCHECHADGIEVRSSGDLKVATSDGTCCKGFAGFMGIIFAYLLK